jgi:hypothetical protein
MIALKHQGIGGAFRHREMGACGARDIDVLLHELSVEQSPCRFTPEFDATTASARRARRASDTTPRLT